jgi:hypothetical protein
MKTTYTKEQIFSLLSGNIHRIQDSLYPNEEIIDIINEQSLDAKECEQYLKWALIWAKTDEIGKHLLIGYIS